MTEMVTLVMTQPICFLGARLQGRHSVTPQQAARKTPEDLELPVLRRAPHGAQCSLLPFARKLPKSPPTGGQACAMAAASPSCLQVTQTPALRGVFISGPYLGIIQED